MKRQSITLVSTLIGALLLPVAPVTAATVSITPTSQITFDNDMAETVRFDALGRAWIWNTAFIPRQSSTTPRLAIFEKESGTWARVQTVRAKKVVVKTLRFDADGNALQQVMERTRL